MNLIEAIVRSPVKVTVGVLLVALFGFISLRQMPMQLTPEVQRPNITVTTRWPGASPQEVEREIIIEQEEQLKGVEGVIKMSSEAQDSVGTITLEFSVGADIEGALLRVNSRLQQVPDYPEDADQPVLTTANPLDRAIAWFILSPKPPSRETLTEFQKRHPEVSEAVEGIKGAHNVGLALLRLKELLKAHPEFRPELMPDEIEVTKLRRFAEDEIEARFERVPGCSQSNVIGGLQDELQVILDPDKLAARQLTIIDVRRVLRAQNEDSSAGDFWEGKRRWVVRTLGQFRDVRDVEEQLLAVRNGAPVYVRDVAEVKLGYRKPEDVVRRFGESSVAINCIRETGANVLDIMTGLQAQAQLINEQILAPRGLQLTQVYDETEYIYSSVNLVQENIFVGGALTMIVLMLFLHLGTRTLLVIPFIAVTAVASVYVSAWSFLICLALIIGCGFWFARGALVVGMAIPTSIIGTFLILGMMGRSLNVISLAGLAFAVGMLVDNAVVVLENIFRRFSEGEDAFTAAIKGTAEVGGAILASTLTTVAVFLPVVFVQEEAGQLFVDIALAISASVSLSMVVSMSLVSMASARLLTRSSDDEIEALAGGDRASSAHGIARWIEHCAASFVAAVTNFNHWALSSVQRQLLTVAVLLGVSAAGTWLLWPKVEYLPNGDRNLVFGILLPPPGYNLNQLMELGETVEQGLRPYWDVDPESEAAQQLDGPVIGDFFFVARGRSVFLGVRAYDGRRASQLVPIIQQATRALPGTFAVVSQSSLFERGITAGRTIDVEITGPELTKLIAIGGQVLGQSMQLIPTAQARPVPSLDLSSPEIHIRPRLLQSAEMAMSSVDLGYTANALVDGAYAGDYYLGGDKIDLTIVGHSRNVQNTQDVEALPVATPTGQLVPLGALADIQINSGPEQVNHRERERAITIQVSPPAEMALETAMDIIRDQIVIPLQQSGQLEGGYRITLAGTADKLRATWQALSFNVALALIITYLLMAALFESWLYPFVIIFSVPLGAVGGVAALALLNLYILQPLDVLTMLGFVILIGTVVNNPILIVHQSLNLMREQGLPEGEAIIESVRTRIRPIFMTTTTTVLGLLPLVLFPGAGSELYRGLGAVVLGGLLISTVFTLVFVPSLFKLTMSAKQTVLRKLFPPR